MTDDSDVQMKILICDTLDHAVVDKLKSIGNCVDISNSEYKLEDLNKNISDAEIVVIRSETSISKDVIDLSNNLRVIARCGVGVDNVDVDYAKSKGVFVTNAPSANIISVVEHTVALIFAVARNLIPSDQSLKKGDWDRKKFIGIELHNKQLGIVGFGKAGKLLSERMRSFGMSVVFYDPFITNWDGPEESVDLDILLSKSDVISIHVIKTKETANMITKDKLDLLKKTAILVNTSRGGVLDEDYFAKLIKEKRIFGGGLDVYTEEPPSFSKEYLETNLITTPHLGASTKEAQYRAGIDTVENIIKILNGDTSNAL